MLRKFWIELRSSLWFVPGLLVVVAAGLALGVVEVDIMYADALRSQRWKPLLNAGAEGARGMLAAIASSMITVAGVAFSITIVTLSLASTQYTPRILRNFMRDRANQFVLGIFVAIFAYCLLVMRTIRGGSEEDGGGFVPLLSVALAVAFALLSIGCLIFFIHHVAASIQASSILKAISSETIAAIEVLFPEQLGDDEEPQAVAPELEPIVWRPVRAAATGYIQHINTDGLLRFTKEYDIVLKMDRGPGDFVVADAPLVFTDRELDDGTLSTIRPHFVVGDFRTAEQDAGFGIRQIVDIAMKALSPGVNDTSTAVSCLDYLGAILFQLASKRMASPFRESDGELRVIAPVPKFSHFVAKSFDEIRLSASGNVTIIVQMLRTIRRVAEGTVNRARLQHLRDHSQLVLDLADQSVRCTYDRERIHAEFALVQNALDFRSGAPVPRTNTDFRAENCG